MAFSPTKCSPSHSVLQRGHLLFRCTRKKFCVQISWRRHRHSRFAHLWPCVRSAAILTFIYNKTQARLPSYHCDNFFASMTKFDLLSLVSILVFVIVCFHQPSSQLSSYPLSMETYPTNYYSGFPATDLDFAKFSQQQYLDPFNPRK